MKDEIDYVLEWVAHHRVIGVDRLRIYDNGSTDGTTEVLKKLAHAGTIAYVDWSAPPEGASPQVSAYNHALGFFDKDDWVAFIDTDEFIVPVTDATIHEAVRSVLKRSSVNVGAIAVNWKTFGSSGHARKTPGLVAERFMLSAKGAKRPNNCFKTLARVEALESMHIHYGVLKDGEYVNDLGGPAQFWGGGMTNIVSHANMQLNHYMVKSAEEYELKKRKGNANFPENHGFKYKRFTDKYFRDFDVNDERDEKIQPFVSKTKDEIEILLKIIGGV